MAWIVNWCLRGQLVPVAVLVASADKENKNAEHKVNLPPVVSFCHGVAWLPERLASSFSYSHWCLSPEWWMPSPSSSSSDHLHTLAHNDGPTWAHRGPSEWQLILSSTPHLRPHPHHPYPTHSQSNLPVSPPPKKKKIELSSELHLSPRNKICCPCQGRWGAQKWLIGMAKVKKVFWEDKTVTVTFIYYRVYFLVQRSLATFLF